MEGVTVAERGGFVEITIDTDAIGRHNIDRAIEMLKLDKRDFVRISEMSAEEQNGLDEMYCSMPLDEKARTLVRRNFPKPGDAMNGIAVFDSGEHSVITVDASVISRPRIQQAIDMLVAPEPDTSHIPPMSDEEQEDIVRSLMAMTPEDKEIVLIRERPFAERFEENLRTLDYSKDRTTGPVNDLTLEQKEEALLGITPKADRGRYLR